MTEDLHAVLTRIVTELTIAIDRANAAGMTSLVERLEAAKLKATQELSQLRRH